MVYLFDLDGTLLDSNGVWHEVDRVFLERHNLAYTKEYFEGVAHTLLPLAAQFTKDYCQLEASCQEIMDEWLELAGDSYANSVSLKPGVWAYLEKCRREGHSLGIVTACLPQHCFAALENLQLRDYFDHLVFAQVLGIEKRNPELYRLAAREAAAHPNDCMVFDDSLAACRSAKSAGMLVVGVHDPLFAADEEEMRRCCHQYIHSFTQLL